MALPVMQDFRVYDILESTFLEFHFSQIVWNLNPRSELFCFLTTLVHNILLYLFAPVKAPRLNVSYKPQKISPKSQGTVRQLLHEKIRDSYIHPQFVTDVLKPLQVDGLMDQEVRGSACYLQFFGV